MRHNLSGQNFLVLGLGKSGLGAIRLLADQGASVYCTDDKGEGNEPSGARFLPPGGISFDKLDCLVVSPGVPLDHPVVSQARTKGCQIIGELELAYQFLRGPIIAITGSNGKTTTVSLCGQMLLAAAIAAQVGGNIGNAVTGMVPQSSYTRWNVLEVSSFQLETIDQFRPQIGAVLNVTPNHLDRHGTFAAYVEAKGSLLKNQLPSDQAVLNEANEVSRGFGRGAKGLVHYFNGEAAHLDEERIELFGKVLMKTGDVLLPGRHNLDNVMAAAVIASLAGASHEAIAQTAASFRGVPHRLELVREWRGIRFYNDSKATSVDAAAKALEALHGPLWVILGGKGKGASYKPLLPLLQAKAKAAVLIGQDSPAIESDLHPHVTTYSAGDLTSALQYIVHSASPGDTVLLAPACASYDQFNSFEHRGDSFRHLVEAL